MIEVKIKTLADIPLPAYQTEGAAAMDLVAAISEDLVLMPHTPVMIPSGIAIELPSREYAALVFARSGLGCKYGIALANGVGVIDSDYRGEIKVGLINLTDTPYTVTPGQRIAQLMISKCETCMWLPTDSLSDTARGEKGHGSTGTV